MQKIVSFVDMINLGNYTTAIEFAKSISSHHALVILRLEDTKIIEKCKVADLFSHNVTVEEIVRFFKLNSQKELENLKINVDVLFDVM